MELKDNDLLTYFNNDILNLTDRDAYEYYKKHRRKKSKGIDEYGKYKRLVGRVFKEIRKGLREDSEGVYINRIGYFCPVKVRSIKKKNSLLLKRDIYKLFFFPDEHFKNLTIEDAYNSTINFELNSTKLKYKPNFKLVESYLHYSEESSLRYAYKMKYDEDFNYKPKTTIIDELT